MPGLKVLSGRALIKIFASFNFEILGQKGSHVKLGKNVHGFSQELTIPNHRELDKGTLKAIYNQASRYISEEELFPHFYKQ